MLPAIGLVAFVYGLVHAALPRHRKVLLVSYVVSTDAPLRHAMIAGVSVAALHHRPGHGEDHSHPRVAGETASENAPQAAPENATEASPEASRVSKFFRNRLGLLPAIVLYAVVPNAGSARLFISGSSGLAGLR